MPKIDPILIRRLRRVSLVSALAALLIAVTTLVGHFARIPVLTTLGPGLAAMKFNTALVMLLAAMAMICRQYGVTRSMRRWATVSAFFATLLAGLTLSQYLTGHDLHIDQLFHADPVTPRHGFHGRMSSATAFALTAVCVGALLLDWAPRMAQVAALFAVLPVLLAIFGYAYGVGSLYQVAAFSSMAIHTALGTFLLAISVLAGRPRRCLHDLLVRQSPGGALVRRVLPATIIVPLLLALLCLTGVRDGWFEWPFGLAVVSLGTAVSIAVILLWNATVLDRVELTRHAAERERDAMLIREHASLVDLERALLARDQLLAVLSHELRQPLTPVLLTTAALLKGPPLPDDLREDIEMIHTQVTAEARIVNDLLEMTALNQGKIQLYRQTIQIEPLLSEMVGRYKHDATRQRLVLSIEPMQEPIHLHADRRRVEQVLSNLLSNAIKFTPSGGKVGLRSCCEGGNAVIEVIDDGIGIDPAALPKLFAYFSQVDNSTRRKFGGMGIGLTIARRLAELHGGTLIATSDGLGRGSRFKLTLPQAEPCAQQTGN